MNRIIKMLIFTSFLFTISCTKQSLILPKTSTTLKQENAIINTAGHFIGERFGGGVIFYLDNTGQHGLIADTNDLPATTWYNGVFSITGVTATNIGSGKSNTRMIVSLQGRPGKYAALECSKSKRSGFTDWYLPSRDELNVLYINKNKVSPFSFGFYWSSSEIHDSSLFTWAEYFYSGSEFGSSKDVNGFVRAIRSF